MLNDLQVKIVTQEVKDAKKAEDIISVLQRNKSAEFYVDLYTMELSIFTLEDKEDSKRYVPLVRIKQTEVGDYKKLYNSFKKYIKSYKEQIVENRKIKTSNVVLSMGGV